MGFEYQELEPSEIAFLALEYLRNAASWMEEAAQDDALAGEVARVLTSAARSTREFHDALQARVYDRYSDSVPRRSKLARRVRRRSDLVSYDDLERHDGAIAVLEIACAEEEEAYQSFVNEAAEIDDPWLRDLFEELARHTRSVILYLEAERESLVDTEGRR